MNEIFSTSKCFCVNIKFWFSTQLVVTEYIVVVVMSIEGCDKTEWLDVGGQVVS